MWIQLIVTVFVLLVVVRSLHQLRQHRMALRTFIIWLILWAGVLVVFWSPETASVVATFFGIGRGADLIVYVAILVIFYLLYRIFERLEKVNSNITDIARSISIKNAKSGKDPSRDSDR